MSDWATNWLMREGGWESRIYEVANFDPIRYEQICDSCTIYEVAKAWKTKQALSDYAWNDPDI